MSSTTWSHLYDRAVDAGWTRLPEEVQLRLQSRKTLSKRVRRSVVHHFLHSEGWFPGGLHIPDPKRPDWPGLSAAVAGQGMQDYIGRVAEVRHRILARTLALRVRVPDPGGALVLAVTLVRAGTTDQAEIDAATDARFDRAHSLTVDAIRTPPATHARWRTVPQNRDVMTELFTVLADAWTTRPTTRAAAPTASDLWMLRERLFALDADDPATEASFQTAWDDYVVHRPWTVHENALDDCGLSATRAPEEPELHLPGQEVPALDRGVLQRLDRPLRQPGELEAVFARTSVHTLILDEIGRSVRPLGLLDEQALTALSLGLAAAELINFTDPHVSPDPTENAPVLLHSFQRVERLARRYYGRHSSNHSPDSLQVKVGDLRGRGDVSGISAPTRSANHYRHALDEPARSFGPRLYPRLHRVDIGLAQGEPALTANNWWQCLDAAFNSWIKDIYGDIKTVVTAHTDALRHGLPVLDPAQALDSVLAALEEEQGTADPLAVVDVTDDRYTELMVGYLQRVLTVTAEQAQAMLPPWSEVSDSIPVDWGPDQTSTEVYLRSRDLCRSLGIVEELSEADPLRAAELYGAAVEANVVRARRAGAVVTARHYADPATFVPRLRDGRRPGTGQVDDTSEEEGL